MQTIDVDRRCHSIAKRKSGKGSDAFEKKVTHRHIHIGGVQKGCIPSLPAQSFSTFRCCSLTPVSLLFQTARANSFSDSTTQRQDYQTSCLRQVHSTHYGHHTRRTSLWRSLTRLALPALLPLATTGTPCSGKHSTIRKTNRRNVLRSSWA